MSSADAGSGAFSLARLYCVLVVSHCDRVKVKGIFKQFLVSPAPDQECGENDEQREAYKTRNTKDDPRQNFVLQETCWG
jgi:hypothetical protein